MEAEMLVQPSRRWDVNLSGGWLHGKSTKSETILQDSFGANILLEGLPLSETPKWSFFSYVAYHVPATGIGKFSLQPELRGVGKINYSITNDPIAYDSAHVFVNLRASWESEDGTYNAKAFQIGRAHVYTPVTNATL